MERSLLSEKRYSFMIGERGGISEMKSDERQTSRLRTSVSPGHLIKICSISSEIDKPLQDSRRQKPSGLVDQKRHNLSVLYQPDRNRV